MEFLSVRNMIQLFGFLWRADTSKSSISYASFIFRQDWNIAKFWTKRYCLACESRNWENQEFIMDREKILKYLYLFFLVSCFVSVYLLFKYSDWKTNFELCFLVLFHNTSYVLADHRFTHITYHTSDAFIVKSSISKLI